jgi:hypothetical protein
MVPTIHVEAPDMTTSEEPLNVPPERSNVIAVAPPVLLKVNPPPLRLIAVTVIAWRLLKTPVPPLADREFPRLVTVAVFVYVVVPPANVVP